MWRNDRVGFPDGSGVVLSMATVRGSLHSTVRGAKVASAVWERICGLLQKHAEVVTLFIRITKEGKG